MYILRVSMGPKSQAQNVALFTGILPSIDFLWDLARGSKSMGAVTVNGRYWPMTGLQGSPGFPFALCGVYGTVWYLSLTLFLSLN